MGGSPLQVVIELGRGKASELAENALKQFKAFDKISV